MKLTKVDTSEVQLTVSGVWISCKITLTMEEYSEGKTSALISGKKAAGSSSSASSKKKTDDYKATLAAKKQAMNATASKSDRAQMKTSKGA